jgi:cobalamin biosynthesis Mg chelatase CobN
MTGHATTSGEGSPAVEQAEQHILGAENYQKAEVVHQFADTHPWFHPLVIVVIILVVAGVGWLIKRKMNQQEANLTGISNSD